VLTKSCKNKLLSAKIFAAFESTISDGVEVSFEKWELS